MQPYSRKRSRVLPIEETSFDDLAMLMLLFLLVVSSEAVFNRFSDLSVSPASVDLPPQEMKVDESNPLMITFRITSESDIELLIDKETPRTIRGKPDPADPTSFLSESPAVPARLVWQVTKAIDKAEGRAIHCLVLADHRARLGTTTQVQLAIARLMEAKKLREPPVWRTLSAEQAPR